MALKSEVEWRTQDSRPRPKTQKNFEAKAKDKPSRRQGPRTQTQVFSKKKGFQQIFLVDLKKKVLKTIFRAKKILKKFFSGDLHLRKTKKSSQIFREVFGVFQQKYSIVSTKIFNKNFSTKNKNFNKFQPFEK